MTVVPNQQNQVSVVSLHRFCYTASILSAICMCIYAILGLYTLAIILAFVAAVFVGILYLNKKKHHLMAHVAIICVTNIGVLVFSIYLGFNTGIFFYLFAAPHLIFLLFNFNQKTIIYVCMASYVVTFILAYMADTYHFITSPLSGGQVNFVYNLNFLFSMIFCFILIIIFAKSNDSYINILANTNKFLRENQINLQREIKEKLNLNNTLSKTLHEKEILLSEIHHRVKNNLAVISGLIELQSIYVKDEKACAVLKESRNRIKSIAVLHEKFYESKSLETVEIRSYVDELIYFIQLSFSTQHKPIKIHTQIDSIELSMAAALPFSLLLNELMTNAYKHAFKDKTNGNIYISFIKHQNKLLFSFRDDGCGFDLANVNKEDSLGMNLIDAFSNQLKSQTTCETKKGAGTEFKLQFIHNMNSHNYS